LISISETNYLWRGDTIGQLDNCSIYSSTSFTVIATTSKHEISYVPQSVALTLNISTIITITVTLLITVILAIVSVYLFLVLSRRNTYAMLQNNAKQNIELSDLWEIDYRDLQIDDCIGTGSFGMVYNARWKNAKCVVKQLQPDTKEESVNFKNEIRKMR
jgi:hypothetical protein